VLNIFTDISSLHDYLCALIGYPMDQLRVFDVMGYQTGQAGSNLQCGLHYISCAQFFHGYIVVAWRLVGHIGYPIDRT
jgi:hypothetical protein